MRVTFLTTDEPFYLPTFFERVLEGLMSGYEIKAIIVPPVYKGTSKKDLVFRYASTFGLYETLNLASKVVFCKIMDILPYSVTKSSYSLGSVFKRYGIDFEYERDVNSAENIGRLRNWETELAISVSCPQIFKKDLINFPPKGCLNLHGAILPQYRGVMPSFWMLANNEREGGLTLFFVNEKIDAGDILVQKKYPISSEETLDSLIKKSKKIGADMVLEGIERIERGQFTTTPLELEGGSYFGWPARKDVLSFLENGRKLR